MSCTSCISAEADTPCGTLAHACAPRRDRPPIATRRPTAGARLNRRRPSPEEQRKTSQKLKTLAGRRAGILPDRSQTLPSTPMPTRMIAMAAGRIHSRWDPAQTLADSAVRDAYAG